MNSLLKNIVVLDLTRMLAGPYGSMLLADMGATVIKIEELTGDRMRTVGPHYAEGESAYFLSINRNKQSITLNLKSAEGRRIFHELVATADVVLENFRPGVMDRLGCGYEVLRGINDDIIMCSLSGYGATGPRRDEPAFDLAIQAAGGAMSVTGEPDGDPVRLGLPMGDLAGGMFSALGIVGALWRRAETGEGAFLDIALLDGQVSLLTYMAQYFLVGGEIPHAWGAQHETLVPYNVFATQDGHIVVAIVTEQFWRNLCDALELEAAAVDPRYASNELRAQRRAEVNALVAERLKQRPTAEWLARLKAASVPAGAVQNIGQVFADSQVLARNMLMFTDHPTIGKLPIVGNPIKAADTPQSYMPPPLLGEHTVEILQERLGYSLEEIGRLRADGVI